jgi:hypothetical protein
LHPGQSQKPHANNEPDFAKTKSKKVPVSRKRPICNGFLHDDTVTKADRTRRLD